MGDRSANRPGKRPGGGHLPPGHAPHLGRSETAIQLALPHGLMLLRQYQRRFMALGMPPRRALQAAASRTMRLALNESRIEYVKPVLKRDDPDLVVDVGANAGQWLSAILRFLRPAQVHAFEPDPAAFKQLQAFAATRPAIQLHQVALGDAAGELTLYGTADSRFSSLLPPLTTLLDDYDSSQVAVQKTVAVPVATLDSSLPDEAIDLLKIDVQGFEERILSGAVACLRRTRVVLIETNFVAHYQGEATFDDLFRLLTKVHGFRFWTIAPPSYGRQGRSVWTDAVFVNPAR